MKGKLERKARKYARYYPRGRVAPDKGELQLLYVDGRPGIGYIKDANAVGSGICREQMPEFFIKLKPANGEAGQGRLVHKGQAAIVVVGIGRKLIRYHFANIENTFGGMRLKSKHISAADNIGSQTGV